MRQYEKSDRTMETGNHLKNGASSKSQQLGLNLKSLLTTVILLCFCAFTYNAMAWTGNGTFSNPWQIKDGGGSGVNAYISGSTLYINGSGNMADFWNSTEGEAPWYANRTSIQTVTIQSGVTNIGNRAFHDCSNLRLITIPNTVTIIGRQSFYNCTNTDLQINIPNSVNEIEGEAFLNSGGTLIIENGNGQLKFTGYSYQYGLYKYDWFKNSQIKNLYLGRNFTYFPGDTPFIDLANLQSLTIGNMVTTIGSNAFANCSKLVEVTIEDGSNILDFPNGLGGMSFGRYFDQCPIKKLYLGRNITYDTGLTACIPFYGKTSLTTLTIGNYVTKIGSQAFYNSGLTQINCKNPIPPEASNNCFYNVYTTCKLYVPQGSVNSYKTATEWKKFFDNGNGFEEGGSTYTLTVSPETYNFSASGGTSSAINVSSNTSWVVSDDASWLTTSKTSGSGNSTFIMTATANTSTSQRSATVTVSGGGLTRTISVTQTAVSGDFVVINGVSWATRNVDAPSTFAATPESAGMFYQWNRKKAWAATGSVSGWDSSTPSGTTWEKVNDPSPAGYRVPTLTEIESLLNTTYVTNEWTTVNGVSGRKFTDRSSGNSIFLPALGCRNNTSDGAVHGVGAGDYWSSTQIDSEHAYHLYIYSDGAFCNNLQRIYGFCIRSVKDNNTNIANLQANQLKVFPNPVKHELTIERDNSDMGKEIVQVIDFSGRIVIISQFEPSISQLKIDVSHLQSGIYLLKIGNYQSKFIKE